MQLTNYIGNVLLNRRAKAGKSASERYPVFKNQIHNTLIVLDNANIQGSVLSDIEKATNPYLGNIYFLIIDKANQIAAHDSGILSMHQIDFRGRLKKNAPALPTSKTPDVLINTLTWSIPRLELLILDIKAPLKIRFDRVSEIFYNFIVPNESNDAVVKVSDLIQVYKALSK